MVASIRTRGDDLKAIARSWWSSMEVNAPIISVDYKPTSYIFEQLSKLREREKAASSQ